VEGFEMSDDFGVQKISIYGSFGEFTVGGPANALKAKYILTKIRPGADGTWDTQLASHMLPWREVFSVEKLSFDELLQRDLDDSRVAHNLIPYLLGDQGMVARFFPPILAVITPRSTNKTGIDDYYPAEGAAGSFGSLFEFDQVMCDGKKSPLGRLAYNPQKCAFIIADGQHRAMAVLALHRQLTKDWKGSAYASYYSHIEISPEDVRHLELPVCLVYFPELTESNTELAKRGITLPKVCRELFVVVNRSAKEVSRSRELLLDDNDLAARLMRRTLSALKGRVDSGEAVAKVNSFAYGDAESDTGKQVASGVLEYCSAVALYKMHSVISFCRPEALHLNKSVDVSSLLNARNADRPAALLLGAEVTERKRITKLSGNSIPPVELKGIIAKLGDLADSILLPLFDTFRPFQVHNESVLQLKLHLSDDTMKSDPIQNKCANLIFEGSGVRSVFEEHVERMREIREELIEEKKEVPKHIQRQIDFCHSVVKALGDHERSFQRRRACLLFGIDYTAVDDGRISDEDRATMEMRARSIYTAVSTQAFQLGFVMAICNVVQAIENAKVAATDMLRYPERLAITRGIVKAFIAGLNRFFAPESVSHRSLSGLVEKRRVQVFDSQANAEGLRRLHAMSVPELNERQWPFFRYVILELVHSELCWPSVEESFRQQGSVFEWYQMALPSLLRSIHAFRQGYIDAAVAASRKDGDFVSEITMLKGMISGQGGNGDAIAAAVSAREAERDAEVIAEARKYIKASLGGFESLPQMASRLGVQLSPEGQPPATADVSAVDGDAVEQS
jgi:hypothetical protein